MELRHLRYFVAVAEELSFTHPRVTTSVLWNSGVLPAGAPTPGGRRLSEATKEHPARLHAPIAYFIGARRTSRIRMPRTTSHV